MSWENAPAILLAIGSVTGTVLLAFQFKPSLTKDRRLTEATLLTSISGTANEAWEEIRLVRGEMRVLDERVTKAETAATTSKRNTQRLLDHVIVLESIIRRRIGPEQIPPRPVMDE